MNESSGQGSQRAVVIVGAGQAGGRAAEALRLGGTVTFLNEAEAAKVGAILDRSVERPWEIWKAQTQAHGQNR